MRNVVLGLVIYTIPAFSVSSQVLVDSFPSPGKDPRGLAWDEEYLWCADARTDSVYRLNSSNGRPISGFSFPIQDKYGGITWSDDDNLWIADGSNIYKVHPFTGEILYSFSCPGV